MTLVQNLKAAREEAGLTHGQLAVVTGVSRTSVHRIENDQQKPSAEYVKEVSEATGVSLDDLHDVQVDLKAFGAAVNAARTDRDWSQEVLGAKVGLSGCRISQIERNADGAVKPVPMDVVRRLRRVLGV